MQNDTNSYGYNQWFYFSVINAIPGTTYTFRIANFVQIYLFSAKNTPSSRRACNRQYFPSNNTNSQATDGQETASTSTTTKLTSNNKPKDPFTPSSFSLLSNTKTIM